MTRKALDSAFAEAPLEPIGGVLVFLEPLAMAQRGLGEKEASVRGGKLAETIRRLTS